MTTEITIPLVFWGGEPIRTLAIASEFLSEDRRLLERWSAFISDPATTDSWLAYQSTGRTWLDISSSDGQRRLVLKPFYVPREGERSIWYFAGFSFLAQDAGVWAGLLEALAKVTFREIQEAGDSLRIVPSTIAPMPQPLLGEIFRGNYETTAARLYAAIAGNSTVNFARLHLASNPPAEDPVFTTLLLSDDFCYRGIQIIADKPRKGGERPSSDTEQTHAHKEVKRESRWPWPILSLLSLACLGMVYHTVSLFKENENLKSQFQSARSEAYKLDERIASLEAEKESLRKQLAESQNARRSLEKQMGVRH